MPKKKSDAETTNTVEPEASVEREPVEPASSVADESAAHADDELAATEKDVDLFEFAERMDLEIVYRGDNRNIHFATFNVSLSLIHI